MYDDRNNKTTAHHERGLLVCFVRTEKVNNNYNIIIWEPINHGTGDLGGDYIVIHDVLYYIIITITMFFLYVMDYLTD